MSDFSDHHRQLSEEELVRIAYFGVGKFKMEARNSAKAELKKRRISDERLKSLKDEVKELNRIERNQKLRNKNEKYGIVDFLIDMIFHW